MEKNERFVPSEDLVIFGDENEIHLRKGIWNAREITITLRDEDNQTRKALFKMAEMLNKNKPFNLAELGSESGVSSQKVTSLLLPLQEEMLRDNFILKEKEKEGTKILSTILGFYSQEFSPPQKCKMLFISDSKQTEEWVKEKGLPEGWKIDSISESLFESLSRDENIRGSDPVKKAKSLEKYSFVFGQYNWIGGCFLAPPLNFLRNLNEVMLKLKLPFTLGFVDGPFLTLASFSPHETGCFACMEERNLGRLKSLKVYKDFQREYEKTLLGRYKESLGGNLLIDLIRSLVILEGISLATLGKSRFMGRILNIYLPTFEIQIGNMLRVPYCPSCGYVSRAKQKELYTDLGKLIEEVSRDFEEVDFGEG
jgi:thiazole/oxazole-forming peptide maturase SagC family component